MTGKPALTALVVEHMAPALKLCGFKKKALVFARRRGDVDQLVAAQMSHGGARFYVNVGLVADTLTRLGGDQVGATVVGGRATHYGVRAEQIVTAPPSWDAASDGEALRRVTESILTRLDAIDGPAAMLRELDLDHGFLRVLRAQLHWVMGNAAAARADIEAVAGAFVERGVTFDDLAVSAGLGALVD